ncbi:MAG TPA: ABC transporter substrate-binding protein [Chloroflexota bacterium]|nr:ABC transporter substrate-binding protein [Chloroflexota bacterium]
MRRLVQAFAVCLAFAAAGCAPAAPPAPQPTVPSGQATVASGQPTVASAPSGAPQKGGTLVIAFNADPETLDPHISTALFAARVIALIHDNLINRDFDGSFKPGLAEKWDISPDGKVYTFTLKKGVKFHSGKDFTSADVKYTFERWLATEKSPTSFAIKPIDKIETPDPLTVRFTLKEPYNIFLDQLAGSWAVILNQEAVDKAGKDYGVSAADGTGPFKFVSWTRNQKLVLARNDAYTWGSPMFQNTGPAYVDGIEIRIIPEDTTRLAEFQAGNVHLVQDVPQGDVERLNKTAGVSVIKYDQLQTTYLGLNVAKAPFDDPQVRQAINLAINRDEIVTGANFGLGTAARTMLTADTPFFWKGSDQVAPTYDAAKAGSLLDSAGWKPGAGGIREKAGQQLVLPLWIINDSTTVLQAQILEQQLAKVGIKVDTKQYEQTAWFAAARTGEQVGFIIGIFFENPDGLLYFYFYSKQQPSPNRFSYSVPEVDKWLEDSRTNPDQAAVQTDYENVQKKLIEDAPAAPLIHALGTLGKTDAVQGVKVHPSRWLYRATDIWLKK